MREVHWQVKQRSSNYCILSISSIFDPLGCLCLDVAPRHSDPGNEACVSPLLGQLKRVNDMLPDIGIQLVLKFTEFQE